MPIRAATTRPTRRRTRAEPIIPAGVLRPFGQQPALTENTRALVEQLRRLGPGVTAFVRLLTTDPSVRDFVRWHVTANRKMLLELLDRLDRDQARRRRA